MWLARRRSSLTILFGFGDDVFEVDEGDVSVTVVIVGDRLEKDEDGVNCANGYDDCVGVDSKLNFNVVWLLLVVVDDELDDDDDDDDDDDELGDEDSADEHDCWFCSICFITKSSSICFIISTKKQKWKLFLLKPS